MTQPVTIMDQKEALEAFNRLPKDFKEIDPGSDLWMQYWGMVGVLNPATQNEMLEWLKEPAIVVISGSDHVNSLLTIRMVFEDIEHRIVYIQGLSPQEALARKISETYPEREIVFITDQSIISNEFDLVQRLMRAANRAVLEKLPFVYTDLLAESMWLIEILQSLFRVLEPCIYLKAPLRGITDGEAVQKAFVDEEVKRWVLP